jgi:8-hydroxy-5-deazaflavin:NADPH oxidoreductase
VKVAVVGGTGPFGRALALRLRDAGHEVTIGSRSARRAREVAEALGVSGAANTDAVDGTDVVVLAVNADAVLDTARELAAAIDDRTVLSVASELRFSREGVYPGPDEISLAERIAGIVSGPVVSGLHSLAAHTLGEGEPPEQDALICGDDEEAKRVVLELAGGLVRGRAVDAGPLAGARALEGLTAVIVNINRRYRAHAGLRVTGLRR